MIVLPVVRPSVFTQTQSEVTYCLSTPGLTSSDAGCERLLLEAKLPRFTAENAAEPSVPRSRRSNNASIEEMDDLPDDILLTILSQLTGDQRHAVGGSCKRLAELSYGLATSISVTLPQPKLSNKAAAAMKKNKFSGVRTLQIQLPSDDGPTNMEDSERPDSPVNTFLSTFLPAARGLETIRIRNTPGTEPGRSHVGHASLAALAASCPQLQRLTLPLLSLRAAAALPSLPSTLTSLSFCVRDGATLDYALQLTQLRSLSISAHKHLLYLVLQQRQVEQLSNMSQLRNLALQNVVLNDCRATWEPLRNMSNLAELRVSSPFSGERLRQLPPSVRSLHLPFFSNGIEHVVAMSGSLTELRCKQALSDLELLALSAVSSLHTLQCDNVIVSAAMRTTQGSVPGSAVVLPQVRSLRVTGIHHMDGLLGAVFPNLESLQMVTLEAPHPLPAYVAPLPQLKRLSTPASKALPLILAVCPALEALQVCGIKCQQRLGDILSLAPCPPVPAAPGTGPAAAAAVPAADAVKAQGAATPGGLPPKLSDLTLIFGSSLRFRPKQIATQLAAASDGLVAQLRSLTLRDSAKDASDAGRVVDDSVVAAAVKRLTGLTRLQLHGCGGITCTGVVHALAAAPLHLQEVEVAACPRTSRRRIERIPAELGRSWLQVQWQAGIEP
mmetsp:Transcript_29578/g.65491  ORF Transcript_29578/g.65491 Transcript_29578/m.65491 type:complete len:669 (-) Transcript_29578:1329-3335(-)|eukprot:CAMPEP_0202902854 /NCGR_PEP_ID=MMETSP1392-20130828/17345_1 /ASSEMBLY_ACC=CAM_ASM_000868 /TAXON_ID=225041 /ORGANISM="Chlamydomonas chlamydogama, Strain SAG 11-48b" /LENGTH=668 /DNA_ID=CAMNT_0049589673 /DNA_START=362 /DNA_END=2368 /DNA_ORIENTATION=-